MVAVPSPKRKYSLVLISEGADNSLAFYSVYFPALNTMGLEQNNHLFTDGILKYTFMKYFHVPRNYMNTIPKTFKLNSGPDVTYLVQS